MQSTQCEVENKGWEQTVQHLNLQHCLAAGDQIHPRALVWVEDFIDKECSPSFVYEVVTPVYLVR